MSEALLPTGIAASGTPYLQVATGSQEAGPVQPRERMQLLDVLRGFALLGILQVNFSFQSPSGALSNLLHFFVDGSFYTTFSFLFGLGFSIQLIRAEEAKRTFILRYLWRTLILFFIGAIHMVFISGFDILHYYAMLAVLLLFVRRWRPGLIIALAAAVLVFSMSPRVPEGHVWTRVNPEQVEVERVGRQLSTATAQANPPAWCQMIPGLTDAYRGDVCREAAEFRTWLTGRVATVRGWKSAGDVLCMFLLGLYAGRRRILRDTVQHTRFFIWVAGVGLVVGLAGNALDVFREFFTGRGIALPKALDGWRLTYLLGNIGLALFYLASITLLFTYRRHARRVLTPLANVGRMGLTNYLMQSVMFAMVIGRGFGIRVEGWYGLLLLNSFFVVQILYSHWWFRYFQFGPVEWLWRSLTWFRVQPMRIAPRPVLQPELAS
jgi:uncharacterized protein